MPARKPLPADDPRHGTPNGYGNLKCRCDRCRAANAAKRREQLRTPRQLADNHPQHGTENGYSYWGCRCDRCCAAWRAGHRTRSNRYQARHVPPNPKPADLAPDERAILRALAATGLSVEDTARQFGISLNDLYRLLNASPVLRADLTEALAVSPNPAFAAHPALQHPEPATTCATAGCNRPPMALGLCRRCYSRRRRGQAVADTPVRGQADGCGRYAILDTSRDGRHVLCHECGDWFTNLGRHLSRHEITAADYKTAHGLPRTLSLLAPAARAAASQRQRARIGGPDWQRFTARRDPAAASAARTAETHQQIASTHRRSGRRTARGPQQRICPTCGRTWQPETSDDNRVLCGSQQCVRQARRKASRHAAATRIEARPDPPTSRQVQRWHCADDATKTHMVYRWYDAGHTMAQLAMALGISKSTMSHRWPRRAANG